MPVTILLEAARNTTVATNLHRDLAQATFVRAALLDDRETAVRAGRIFAGLKPEVRQYITAYEAQRRRMLAASLRHLLL